MAPADHTHGGPFRSAPSWPGRVAAAHTVAREILGVTRARLDTEQAAKISVPVLLLIGEKARTPQSAKLARSQPHFRMRGCWCWRDSSRDEPFGSLCCINTVDRPNQWARYLPNGGGRSGI